MSEEQAKVEGKARAALNNAEWLSHARDVAVEIASRCGCVSIEEVREQLLVDGYMYTPGNWMGSLFSDSRFVATGDFFQARHKGGHRRLIRVWKLR